MRSWILGLAVFAGLAMPATSSADLPDIDVRADRDAAYAGRNDALLTGRSSATPSASRSTTRATRFGLGADDIASLELVARAVSPDGITHLRYNQVLDGIESYRQRPGRARHARRPPDHSSPAARSRGARLPDTERLGSARSRASARRARDRTASRLPPRGRQERPDHDASSPARRRSCAGSPTADGPRLAWDVIVEGADGRRYAVLVDAESRRHARPQGPHRAPRRRPLLPARPGHVAAPRRSRCRPPGTTTEQRRHAAVGPVRAHLHRPQRPGPRPGRRAGRHAHPDPGRAAPGSRTGSTRRHACSRAPTPCPVERLHVGHHDRRPRGRPTSSRRRPTSTCSSAASTSTSRRRRSASTRRRATSSASTPAAPGSATTTSAPRSTTARASTTPTSRRRPTATRRACRCTCSPAAT